MWSGRLLAFSAAQQTVQSIVFNCLFIYIQKVKGPHHERLSS